MRKSTIAELRQLFEHSIPASSIAEPLASFDREASIEAVRDFMDSAGFDVLGIRSEGLTRAFVLRDELDEAQSTADVAHPVTPELTVQESGSLLAVLGELSGRPFVFISSLGQATGIVTRADLAKAPVRMWLFNLVTLLEMHILLVIRDNLPEDQWVPCLKPERVDRARSLFSDRQQRSEDIDLVDCLQFCDKKEIVVHFSRLRSLFGGSKRKVQRFLEDCEDLRNDLAHAQEIPSAKWPEVAHLAGQIERLLGELDAASEPAGR